MNIYFSGIGGTGIGPLALLASDAGLKVFGSDLARGAVYDDILESGAELEIGPQDGKFLQKVYDRHGINWFVHTSALPSDHPELVLAKKLGIKVTKRDDLINYIINEKNLELIAIAGTHGKTTTTAMMIWACQQLSLPISYAVGTTLPFARSGQLDSNSKYLVYECDEYDRNFLKFRPKLALITTVSYDHTDIYPTKEDYRRAFEQFEARSEQVVHSAKNAAAGLTLPGQHNRANATLVIDGLAKLGIEVDQAKLVGTLNRFPGSNRRFEKLAEGLYTDYAHHPDEIAATIQMARELSDKVAVIYQPHQNTRQHQVKSGYVHAFDQASKVFWLPTYLTREDPSLPVITPAEFIDRLANKQAAQPAELNDELWLEIQKLRSEGFLVLLLAAGPADSWLRQKAQEVIQ
ncbi:MAG: Mur ligase domain-containing protein [Candidatus Nomurabacteria bacterium]|jgi:UDP-N-acetylmuramate--alanine ligase|nr:Mur ligase domain-containing protein [Candidatus Nomurabacteria bacterium]